MPELGEYKFDIRAFTPLTLPMKRLYEYLKDLIDLFGNEDNVHFLRVDDGSAAPAMFVDRQAITKVEKRLMAVATHTASARAMNAFASINDKLASDNTSAELVGRQGRILYFPGKELKAAPLIGPVIEPGTVEGEIIQIGGRDDSIQVYLRDGERIYICGTNREEGRKIAQYLFQRVRLYGQGKWVRNKDESWKLFTFEIAKVIPLKNDSLSEAVRKLRAIEAPELAKIQDPWIYLDEIRREAGESVG